MDFLNIGMPELLVIALIGLILFGPEDLLKFARMASGYLRSAQRFMREIASQMTIDLASAAPDPSPDGAIPPTPPLAEAAPPDEAPHEAGYGP